MSKEIVYQTLESLGIPYERYQHEAAYHMEDCAELDRQVGAVTCKNYFLCTRRKKVYVLCIVSPEARLNTSNLSAQAGTARLSFAGEEPMRELLNVYPGAVSPFGLIFDRDRQVRFLMDSALKSADRLAFHPCDNTETVVISAKDFVEKYLPYVGRTAEYVDMIP